MELSDWEGEFLDSVAQRVKTYGRAFGDPDKGAPGTPLSVMQGVKLKEIAAKAAGKGQGKDGQRKDVQGKDGRRFGRRPHKPFGRRQDSDE